MSAQTTFYTRPDDEFTARGYWHDGKPWVVADVPGLSIQAPGNGCIDSMQRLIDVLTSAVAQARQAEQDHHLVDLADAPSAVA